MTSCARGYNLVYWPLMLLPLPWAWQRLRKWVMGLLDFHEVLSQELEGNACVFLLEVSSSLITTQTGPGMLIWLGTWLAAVGSRAAKVLLPQMWERLGRVWKGLVVFTRWDVHSASIKSLAIPREVAPQSFHRVGPWAKPWRGRPLKTSLAQEPHGHYFKLLQAGYHPSDPFYDLAFSFRALRHMIFSVTEELVGGYKAWELKAHFVEVKNTLLYFCGGPSAGQEGNLAP